MRKLDPVVFKLGSAVLVCQIFEGSLVLLHQLIDEEENVAGKTLRIGSDYNKHTLGRLINLLKRRIDVPADAMEFVYEAIEIRNEVIHGYMTFPQNMAKFESDDGINSLILDLDDRTNAIRNRDNLVCSLIDQYLEKYGTSTKKLKQLAEEHSFLYRES